MTSELSTIAMPGPRLSTLLILRTDDATEARVAENQIHAMVRDTNDNATESRRHRERLNVAQAFREACRDERAVDHFDAGPRLSTLS